jgi:hypothetical protein
MDKQLENLLAEAAALRAGGMSWKSVAAAVKRDVETVRRWPERYPAEWSRYRRAAEDHLVGDAYGESITSLRVLLRSENEKSRLAASVAIVKARHDQRRLEVSERIAMAPRAGGKQQELSTDGQRIAAILDGMSMEEMQEMAKKTAPPLLGLKTGQALKPVDTVPEPSDGGEHKPAEDT